MNVDGGAGQTSDRTLSRSQTGGWPRHRRPPFGLNGTQD